MKYGNCFTGAIALMFTKRSIRIRATWDLPPHFYVIDKEGKKWHYGVKEDVLSWPWGLFWYKGEFRRYLKPRN